MTAQADLRVAAVQPSLAVGDVDGNLRRIADLARSAAREHHPELLVLPESMGSPSVFHPALRGVARPITGAPFEMLAALALELDCTVGGGFVAVRGEHTRHAYLFVDPDGTTNVHEKDQPSMWENNYYRPGHDDGVFTWGRHTLGCAMGMEWDRSRTAARLRGRADLVAGGSCWWSFPDWPLVRHWFGRDHQYNVGVAREMTARMARCVGAPAVIAQHVGHVVGRSPLMPGVPWDTVLVGETQITNRNGDVLERLSYDDGEGHVGATIEIGSAPAADPVPSGFWMVPLPASLQAVWHLQNLHGRFRYWRDQRDHRFPWQQQGAAGTAIGDDATLLGSLDASVASAPPATTPA